MIPGYLTSLVWYVAASHCCLFTPYEVLHDVCAGWTTGMRSGTVLQELIAINKLRRGYCSKTPGEGPDANGATHTTMGMGMAISMDTSFV